MTTTEIDATVTPQPVSGQQMALEKREPPMQLPPPPVTAAQAKVEAIASLTMSAYSKAATLQLTSEEIAALQADFPDEAFQPGAGGKDYLIYIEHAHLRDRLNKVLGPGQWAIIPRNRWAEPFTTQKGDEGSRVYVEAMLLIRGCFVSEAVGAMEYYPKNAGQNYGDAVEGAKTAALRRCAKELGVGLQAWKKEWCDGWWKRRKAAARPQTPQTQPAPPPKPQNATQPPPASATVPPAPKCGTEATRSWMIEKLHAKPGEPARDIVTEYFRNVGNPSQLMPNEQVEDLQLRFVPVTPAELRKLGAKIAGFEAGDPPEPAFAPHDDAPQAEGKSEKPAKAVEVPRTERDPLPKSEASQEPWYPIIVPIPHRGESRNDYLKNPDTIGSLYEARHGEDEAAAEARRRLFGFVNNYEPKGWTTRDGTQMPPSATDIKFREALDQFAEFFQRNHPDEKL